MSSSRLIEKDCNLDLTQRDMCSAVSNNQVANDPDPPSNASIKSLKKVFVTDMTLGSRHLGSYILVRLHTSEHLHLGIGAGVDETENIVGVRVIPQNGKQVYNEYLGDAEFMIIKEPLYIAYPEGSGGYIPIYHISDVVALSPSDPSLPQKWKLQVERTMDEWRLVGNQAVREGKFYNAINCYNQALLQARSHDDLRILRLNRCHARISVQCFDTALEDANAVLQNSADNEKALFRKAEALYHLRRFKDCQKALLQLTSLYPDNKSARQRLERVDVRLQEEAGNYDFPAMLKGTSEPTRLDRASFIGCVEVRDCKLKSRGRGLFLTKPVKVGELLLCEKAFSVSLMSIHENIDQNLPAHGLEKARDDLCRDCIFQLHRNPSQLSTFTELHSGSCKPEKMIVDGQPIIDGCLIDSTIGLNCYKFPQSRDYHSRFVHLPADLLEYPGSAGMWMLASYINHSCLPNIKRAFIGDMILIRAAQNLSAGSELTHSYINILGTHKERQDGLKDYGFRCHCRRCQNDQNTSWADQEKRCQLLSDLEVENSKLATMNPKSVLKTIENLLDQFDATFTVPASQIPRMQVYMELYISILNLHRWDLSAEVVTMVRKLLIFSGFHVRINQTRFRITRWGSVNDFTVVGLAYMWKAYSTVNPLLCDDVEEALKLAYEIEMGERSSFEDVYGELRPTRTETSTRTTSATNRLSPGGTE